ncbi:MAG TPA: vanadium-dependent haloperoxidase [Candidatus Polarisedimenticolia bacterium]|nr:vanadium-dependent haloperoxidase [Candidatus Polarisedimenticolia bacterium]
MGAHSPRAWFLTFAILFVPACAMADAVTEWNEKALAAATQAKQLPFVSTRTMALVHTAMFDAVNSIEGRCAPYKFKVSAPAGSSSEAAVVAAAHAVLLSLFPEQKADLDAAYAASLARIPEGSGKTAGIGVGEEIAVKILALRASDGSDAPNVYKPATTPGAYIPTALPIGSHWGNVTPWVMKRGSQFRPAPPPVLNGPVWARDYNEIKDLGAKKSTVRTAEQTDIARFWILAGPASWEPIVRHMALTPGRSLIQNARLFALVEIAAADAYIAVFDGKYTFQFWRPITAIRNGDINGNAATTRVPDWEPSIDTPLHPEYPCAHCITSAAVATVLESEFGNGAIPVVTMSSPTAPGVTRKWTRIWDWADEISAARIYGGIHYRNSTVVGQAMGKKIGELAFQNCLKPIH